MSGYISKDLAWHFIKLAMPISEREKLVEAFNKIPTADVEMVVHCKDCKWNFNIDGIPTCTYLGIIIEQKHYCSYGELRGYKG